MMDVFVSFAVEDERFAAAVRASVEAAGFECRLAGSDNLAGTERAAAAIEAINNSRVLVLVFSSSANRSPEVVREVERALARRIPIVPFRIENVLPTGSLEYFLSIPHWLDAFEPPFEYHLQRLNHQIGLLLSTAQEGPEPSADIRPRRQRKKLVRTILGVVVVALVALLGLAVYNLAQSLFPPPVQHSNFKYETILVDRAGSVISLRQGTVPAIQEDLGKGVFLKMVLVPGGGFVMGSSPAEASQVAAEIRRVGSNSADAQWMANSEGPQGEVNVVPFYLSPYEITQKQWEEVAGFPKARIPLNASPSEFKGEDQPVERVSWEEAVEFCDRLARRTRRSYRLPTEAEWEYACRAGSTAPFGFGESVTREIAQFNSRFPWGMVPSTAGPISPAPVNSFRYANGFGLSVMNGNVFEWCQDTWHDTYVGSPAGARAWEADGSATSRVLRGGAFNTAAVQCRCEARSSAPYTQHYNNVGFRIALFSAEIEEN